MYISVFLANRVPILNFHWLVMTGQKIMSNKIISTLGCPSSLNKSMKQCNEHIHTHFVTWNLCVLMMHAVKCLGRGRTWARQVPEIHISKFKSPDIHHAPKGWLGLGGPGPVLPGQKKFLENQNWNQISEKDK